MVPESVRSVVRTAALSTGGRLARAAAAVVLTALGIETADEFWIDALIVIGAVGMAVVDWTLCNASRIRALLVGPEPAPDVPPPVSGTPSSGTAPVKDEA